MLILTETASIFLAVSAGMKALFAHFPIACNFFLDSAQRDERKMGRERANNYTKRRETKGPSQKKKKRFRVDIGVAITKWHELKAKQGLKSDSEVAMCLLDV